MAHALLSPSAASRWFACTPSARMEEGYPDKSGEAAKEGTVAHALGEALLRQFKGEYMDLEIDILKTNSYYNAEMQRHAEAYRDYVIERFNELVMIDDQAIMALETRLDLTKYIPEGFGTSDCTIVAEGYLDVIDLKYGKGVLVDAEENKQMMIYALGALAVFGFAFDIQRVRMTIFQPRLDNYSIFEISADELLAWGENELKKQATLAFAGEGDPSPGKHCTFCKVKAQCRALNDYNQGLARYDFKASRLLSNEEIAEVLNQVDLLTSWANAVYDYALSSAVSGIKFPGWKVVQGRSNRKYDDSDKVAEEVLKMGFKEKDVYTKTLVNLGTLEKLIGKDGISMLGNLIVKPPGAPTLVPESDKRPEFNSAALDFA
ncbi:DUF2800 domain-containing protein [Siphonobacter sp. SORGH_AS_1065]|uniref:DUF2800 domain-containing protein n=1 Tax=Siphonobacter sp. SORGH_AS_1065 TaxID=3041795 RepID=UPI00277DD657|nr:DUF2800 domain-containing protein [Siphonobacter sp. SORGH_AS_1065]MDQ1088601.1 hypothetical protein [Siphonobacter sp. SORGH_AS_1065]